MKKLTLEILGAELSTWMQNYGKSRNEQDLRFGQFIWCNYDMKELFPEPEGSKDGFGAEDPNKAFEQISGAFLDK